MCPLTLSPHRTMLFIFSPNGNCVFFLPHLFFRSYTRTVCDGKVGCMAPTFINNKFGRISYIHLCWGKYICAYVSSVAVVVFLGGIAMLSTMSKYYIVAFASVFPFAHSIYHRCFWLVHKGWWALPSYAKRYNLYVVSSALNRMHHHYHFQNNQNCTVLSCNIFILHPILDCCRPCCVCVCVFTQQATFSSHTIHTAASMCFEHNIFIVEFQHNQQSLTISLDTICNNIPNVDSPQKSSAEQTLHYHSVQTNCYNLTSAQNISIYLKLMTNVYDVEHHLDVARSSHRTCARVCADGWTTHPVGLFLSLNQSTSKNRLVSCSSTPRMIEIYSRIPVQSIFRGRLLSLLNIQRRILFWIYTN